VVQEIQKYLIEILGLKVQPKPWKGTKGLPLFLQAEYSYLEILFHGKEALLMILDASHEETPAKVKKHVHMVQKQWDGVVIVVLHTISSFNRKRLIDYRIPFIVPHNQCYLPEMGIDLRERFLKRKSSQTYIGPAAQTIILYALTRKENEHTLSKLTNALHYSKITMSRAFNELEQIGIGNIFLKGRERALSFDGSKKLLWEKSKPHLRSPIEKKIWLRTDSAKLQGIPLSGLSALGRITMLQEPPIISYSIGSKQWVAFRKRGKLVGVAPSEEPNVELEVWSYDPTLFAQHGHIDPFSLYLSLQDMDDERVILELDKMIRKIL
jgi:hypothetical protein